MARTFIICPFGTKKDSAGEEINFELIQEKLIEPALKATHPNLLEGGQSYS